MAIEVFNRYEKKYIIDEDTFHKLTYQIADYMNPDAYNRNGEAYRISNIYYDTENDQLIRASIEKPVYKEKLRLRAYGMPELTDNVFVEIKKKYNGIVNKRRTSMTLQEAYDFLDDDICPDNHEGRINRQVLKEIDYFKNFYHLQPKVYLLSLIHISEPTRRTPISYAVFCLKKKNNQQDAGVNLVKRNEQRKT